MVRLKSHYSHVVVTPLSEKGAVSFEESPAAFHQKRNDYRDCLGCRNIKLNKQLEDK